MEQAAGALQSGIGVSGRRPVGLVCHDAIVGLYERHAREFDRDRGRSLWERAWLDRFLDLVPQSGTVLDIGCGMGEPIARFLIDAGRRVVGVDSSPSMIAICRERFPDAARAEWMVGDMRALDLGRRFDGILAWDSFFHLCADDQRPMFGRFAAHAKVGAPLLFTSGSKAGEAIGTYCEEPLYHASLDPAEYQELLEANGFTVAAYRPDDPDCAHHTVWLANRAVTPAR